MAWEITSQQKKRLTAKGTTSRQSVGHWTSEQRSANSGCKTSIFSDPFHPAVVDFFREFYKLKLNACIYILFLLPRGYSFCREVFSSAVRFFLLSWVSFFWHDSCGPPYQHHSTVYLTEGLRHYSENLSYTIIINELDQFFITLNPIPNCSTIDKFKHNGLLTFETL